MKTCLQNSITTPKNSKNTKNAEVLKLSLANNRDRSLVIRALQRREQVNKPIRSHCLLRPYRQKQKASLRKITTRGRSKQTEEPRHFPKETLLQTNCFQTGILKGKEQETFERSLDQQFAGLGEDDQNESRPRSPTTQASDHTAPRLRDHVENQDLSKSAKEPNVVEQFAISAEEFGIPDLPAQEPRLYSKEDSSGSKIRGLEALLSSEKHCPEAKGARPKLLLLPSIIASGERKAEKEDIHALKNPGQTFSRKPPVTTAGRRQSSNAQPLLAPALLTDDKGNSHNARNKELQKTTVRAQTFSEWKPVQNDLHSKAEVEEYEKFLDQLFAGINEDD